MPKRKVFVYFRILKKLQAEPMTGSLPAGTALEPEFSSISRTHILSYLGSELILSDTFKLHLSNLLSSERLSHIPEG